MLKAVIVDDESAGRDALKGLLARISVPVEIVTFCESAESAVVAIDSLRPDLVFLDIEMPGGSGFSVLEKVKYTGFDVIFTTAHNQYAIKAFRYSAMDYLLKPIIKEELEQAVAKAAEKRSEKYMQQKIDFFIDSLRHKNKPLERIAINTSEGFHILQLADIIRLEADNNYTRFYLAGNEKILVAKTLKDFEEMLSDAGFMRVHQSHLINLSRVKKYIKGEGGFAVMSDGSQVEVSRRNKAQFLASMGG